MSDTSSQQAAPDEGAASPRLEDVLAAHRPDDDECACGKFVWTEGPDWSEHAAAMWREACTIRTVDQLDELPEGAIVRDTRGDPWIRIERDLWLVAGSEVPYSRDDPEMPEFPVALIWHPGWSAS